MTILSYNFLISSSRFEGRFPHNQSIFGMDTSGSCSIEIIHEDFRLLLYRRSFALKDPPTLVLRDLMTPKMFFNKFTVCSDSPRIHYPNWSANGEWSFLTSYF